VEENTYIIHFMEIEQFFALTKQYQKYKKKSLSSKHDL